ncbi:MAG: dTDP-4-dehydrorhamnose reductase [Bacteroidales bacterium]
MQILVTGSLGQLGMELQSLAAHYPDYSFLFTDRASLDVTDGEAVRKFFKKQRIDCLINCAGHTGVDQAEADVENAHFVNAKAAGHLAEAASKAGALMVHLSTDYVFDGKGCRPYTEGDPANPRSVYGKSKLDGELEVLFNAKRSVIFRTSWLYSSHGNNFMKSILKQASAKDELKVVYDQVGTPTYARDLARTILDLLPAFPSRIRGEIYNYSNEGVASWYDFARAILEMKGSACRVIPVTTAELPVVAARPHYSVLDKSRIKRDFGVQVPYWRDSLRDCLSVV